MGTIVARVEVDPEKCCGYGNCVIAAPDLFDVDDVTGRAVALVAIVDQSMEAAAELAVNNCPVAAISIVK